MYTPLNTHTHNIEVNCLKMPPKEGTEVRMPAPSTVKKHRVLLQLTLTDQIICNYMLFENGCYRSEELRSRKEFVDIRFSGFANTVQNAVPCPSQCLIH